MTVLNETKSLLQDLLITEDFETVFQPIFDIHSGVPVGYEALTRGPAGHPLQSPNKLFEAANEFGVLSELELLCRKLAIARFSTLELEGKLFLNVSPHTMEMPSHPHGETLKLLKQTGLAPDRLVIEVTERFHANDHSLLNESLAHYRNMGLQIAIDDLGTGHSGLKQWAELRPDLVKIDRYFISDCHNNIVKREFLRTIFELGKATGVGIIAEGIESNEEFLLLKNLGMRLAQGYLLGRPATMPNRTLPAELLDKPKQHKVTQVNRGEFELSNLVSKIPPITSNNNCLEVYRRFQNEKHIYSLVVVNEASEPIGIVYRDQLTEILSSDYGHALYDRKSISSLMLPVYFAVEVSSPIDEVSNYITDNEEFDQRPEFLVVERGKYFGLANVRSLLKKMTEEKIKHAQHANPLTMLPGNIVIQQRINHLINHQQSFTLAYFDLDHFKPFNDLYGYAAGDNVIKLVADILADFCNNHFVGHVGGDDFVVIFQSSTAKDECEQIMQAFDRRIKGYFEPEHLEQNGYWTKSRSGELQLFPLLSISCGVITPDLNVMQSHHDVAALASEAKKGAKGAEQGEVYVHPPHIPLAS